MVNQLFKVLGANQNVQSELTVNIKQSSTDKFNKQEEKGRGQRRQPGLQPQDTARGLAPLGKNNRRRRHQQPVHIRRGHATGWRCGAHGHLPPRRHGRREPVVS